MKPPLALQDMLQNHLMQLFKSPQWSRNSLDADSIHRKMKVIQATHLADVQNLERSQLCAVNIALGG